MGFRCCLDLLARGRDEEEKSSLHRRAHPRGHATRPRARRRRLTVPDPGSRPIRPLRLLCSARLRETLAGCPPRPPNPNPSSVLSLLPNASKTLGARPMGRRKERRLAAMAAAGRRVKLDLFLDPFPGKFHLRPVWFDVVEFNRYVP